MNVMKLPVTKLLPASSDALPYPTPELANDRILIHLPAHGQEAGQVLCVAI